MEDNLHNELIENGTIHNFLRSGTNRIISERQIANLQTLSSKSKLKQRNVEQHVFTSQSHETTNFTSANTDNSEKFYSNMNIDIVDSEKCQEENGLSASENVEILAGGYTPSSLSNHKHESACSDVTNSRQSSTRSAYMFYKAAGDWWNVFPKTDYTYSKSSSCRKEIAPGVMTMPNMSRSPLRSSLNRNSVENSSRWLSRSYNNNRSADCTDDSYRASSTTRKTTTLTTKRSTLIRIITTIWHILSSVSSVLTFKKYRLGFESTPVAKRGGYVVERTSGYRRLEVLMYQSACYFLLLDSWILSLFHSSRHHSRQLTEKKKHSKYLLLLLIPPLLWLGLWYNSSGTSALSVLSSSMTGVKNLLPSLLVQKTGISETAKHTDLSMEDGNMELLVQKILSSSEFKNIILMQDFRNKEQQKQNEKAFLSVIELEQERLKTELDRESFLLVEQKNILMKQQVANERLTLENSAMKDQIEQLEMQMKLLQAHRLHLSRKITDCRKIIIRTVPKIEIEQHVTHFLSGLFDFNGKNEDSSPKNMKNWIRKLLTAKDDLEQRLADTVSVVNERIEEAVGKSAETIMASVSDMMREEYLKQNMKLHASEEQYVSVLGGKVSGDPCDPCLSDERVKEIVTNALHRYDADKTGMVDYALESAGGTVINIRCTEIYNEKSLALAFLGMTFPWSSNHPRIALQPEVHPGKCFAFRGAQGYIVIRLANRIKISAFSIEHIPVSISPTGNINAAPKNFSVWGLSSENDRDEVLLGKYMYQTTGPPLQTFPVQNEDALPYQVVELKIESNHGNLEYTCLYRFRVHGVVV